MLNLLDVTAVFLLFIAKIVFSTDIHQVTPRSSVSLESTIHQVTTPWTGTTTRDLHREYQNIFKVS